MALCSQLVRLWSDVDHRPPSALFSGQWTAVWFQATRGYGAVGEHRHRGFAALGPAVVLVDAQPLAGRLSSGTFNRSRDLEPTALDESA